MKTIYLFIALFSLAPLTACDPGAACTDECETDKDCASGLACFGGECLPDECNNCTAGETCFYSADVDDDGETLMCEFSQCS